MSVDHATVRRIAHLARIAIDEVDVAKMGDELNAILRFVEELDEVDVTGIDPMISVIPMRMTPRADVVTDGGMAEAVLANAPDRAGAYYAVPKVVE